MSDAYNHYLRGRYLRLRVTESSLRRAIQHFEEAIAIDPDYADAHAGLADALLTLGAPRWEIDPPGPTLTRAMAAADRAIGLAPRHADALTVRALIRLDLDGNRAGAEQDVRDGLAINPSLARGHLYYSSILAATGRFDEAVREAEAAHALDPLNPGSGTTFGIRLYYAGRYQDALATMDRVLDTDGNFAPSQVDVDKPCGSSVSSPPQSTPSSGPSLPETAGTYYDARLGHAYAIRGRVSEARTVLARLETASRNRYVLTLPFRARLRRTPRQAGVMAWLRRCREDRSGWITWLGVEREFSVLLNKPAFAEFVR